MNNSFKPFIEHYRSGYWLTAPRPIREKVWSILHDIQDNVIDIEGGSPTEICVNTNPGYDTEEALVILTVATHIALNQPFDKLYAIGKFDDHIKKIKEQIEFKISGTFVFEAKTMYWLGAYIVETATRNLNQKAEKITGLNSNWAISKQMEVLKIQNQVRDQLSWITQPLLKYDFLKQCSEALSALQKANGNIIFVNKNVQVLKENAAAQVAIFIDSLKSDVALFESFQNYSDSLSDINRWIQDAAVFRELLTSDEDDLNQMVAMCKTLVS